MTAFLWCLPAMVELLIANWLLIAKQGLTANPRAIERLRRRGDSSSRFAGWARWHADNLESDLVVAKSMYTWARKVLPVLSLLVGAFYVVVGVVWLVS